MTDRARRWFLGTMTALAVAGAVGAAPAAWAAGPLQVVTTTGMIADVVRRVGGDVGQFPRVVDQIVEFVEIAHWVVDVLPLLGAYHFAPSFGFAPAQGSHQPGATVGLGQLG